MCLFISLSFNIFFFFIYIPLSEKNVRNTKSIDKLKLFFGKKQITRQTVLVKKYKAS